LSMFNAFEISEAVRPSCCWRTLAAVVFATSLAFRVSDVKDTSPSKADTGTLCGRLDKDCGVAKLLGGEGR
jgi:hypothetical protein